MVACHRTGKDVTLVTFGSLLENTMEAAKILAEQGVEATVLRLLEVSDVHAGDVLSLLPESKKIIVAEEVAGGSGICGALAYELGLLCPECTVAGIDLGRKFVPHGAPKELYKDCGLDAASIAAYTKEVLS